MRVYQTDPEGYYVGPTVADPDPLDKGGWLIPGGAVTAPPPTPGEGELAQWRGSGWEIVSLSLEATPEEDLEPSTPEELRAALPPITKRQLRLTLVRNGVALDDVAAMIEAMPDGLAKEEARIEWADASEFDRLHPTLVLIGEGLGMAPEQVDELWAEALGA